MGEQRDTDPTAIQLARIADRLDAQGEKLEHIGEILERLTRVEERQQEQNSGVGRIAEELRRFRAQVEDMREDIHEKLALHGSRLTALETSQAHLAEKVNESRNWLGKIFGHIATAVLSAAATLVGIKNLGP